MYTLLIHFVFLLILTRMGLTVLPQVSQEGLLRPYRSYADVTLFHYYVPKEVSLATFEFAAFMDNPNCYSRNVYVYLQHGSYPVMSPDNSTFPPNMYTERTSMYNLTLQSAYQPHNATVFKVYYPLPGSWFASGYLPNWDQHVQQEGLGHKCQYSLGSIGVWTPVSNIESLPLDSMTRVKSLDHYTYYRFYIPSGIWKMQLTVDGCQFATSRRPMSRIPRRRNSSALTNTENHNIRNMSDETWNKTEIINTASCVENIFVQAKSLPNYSTENMIAFSTSPLTEEPESFFTYEEELPYTDSYYYILIVSESKVSYNITISVQDCPIQILEKTFIQRYAGFGLSNTNVKEQAIRMNITKLQSKTRIFDENECKCVPIFRLTRIKHPQDFSDTFLLESKDWFTTWLALNDAMPVGVLFELLPYVDIGGTLSVGIHLDDMLVNSTDQEFVVTGCIRKSRPPNTFCCKGDDGSKNISDCCETGLSLHISSKSFSTLDDTVLIPYPEPDIWFVSFSVICYFQGDQVPCAVPEGLISLDIRTQPCVLSKAESPQGPVLPCGNYGVCQEVHKGQFFYTTCRCIGGYRGWACTDDSEATPEYLLLISTLLLTLSNAFFAPAIVLACKRRMFTQAIVYLSTMIASTLYHACDQDIFGYCLTRYQVLQFCDFFSSILAFWVTLIALAKCPPKYDSTLYIIGAIVIAVGVEYNRTGLLVFIVPFSLGIGIPLSVWTYRSVKSRTCIKPEIWSVVLFLPGVCLGAAGLILFAFVETEENYRYTHSAWHVIIALSLLYLLPKRVKKSNGIGKGVDCNTQLEISNSAELAAVSDPSTSSTEQNPIFFITSELDHLVQHQLPPN